MKNKSTEKSLRKAALVAGWGLLVMTIFAVGAIYFAFPKIVDLDSAEITVSNIITHGILFRVGIISLVIVVICDVVVAWALYMFLGPVNKMLALFTAWFRLVYAIILGIALSNYFNVLQLLSAAENLNGTERVMLHINVMLSLNAVDDVWAIGLVFFGIHLVLLGHLVSKARYVPGILGVLLMLAGFSYLIDNFGMLIYPGYDLALAKILGWGELVLMFWLLFRGGRVLRS